jgi:hypothetical protein
MVMEETTTALSNAKLRLARTTDVVIKIAAIVGAITVIAGGYSFYINNIWKPNVEIIMVDFNIGVAEIKFHNKSIFIYGDATFNLGGDWGIRFGVNNGKYESVELTKKGMVVEYLKK